MERPMYAGPGEIDNPAGKEEGAPHGVVGREDVPCFGDGKAGKHGGQWRVRWGKICAVKSGSVGYI